MRLLLLLFVSLTWPTAHAAESLVRWNQAGYPPERPKVLVVMAERDLTGEPWEVRQGGTVEFTGKFAASVVGRGPHTPLPYNHTADLSALRDAGRYTFHAPDAEPATIEVAAQPYRRFIAQALQHLRMVRSGTDDVPAGRRRSHAGDARAPVWVPEGDPAEGRWRPAEPARTVDVHGGWYDAGDQIKFTLNEAYTTYVLLLAYQWRPDLFPAGADGARPALLEEALHGLRYLSRLYPDEHTFIVQVGDERDHNQPERLPENDPLDGQRPALSALSRVHLASTAAALALGARTFGAIGLESAEAAQWTELAERLYARTQDADTIASAFERGRVNDFYHDQTEVDQRALAAAELYALTGDARYRDDAVQLAPPPAAEVSWMSWNAHANAALAPYDPAALARLHEETARYCEHAQTAGRPWQVPGRLVWASLHRWIGAAHAAQRAALLGAGDEAREQLFYGMLDYTFGRNNWGVSFVFSPDLPNTVQHIYSPLYRLLDTFPTGALSEGPGNRATHASLSRYFEQARERRALPHRPELATFNTEEAVFADDAADFMCQEATIGGQADLILLLTLASREAP